MKQNISLYHSSNGFFLLEWKCAVLSSEDSKFSSIKPLYNCILVGQ